MKSSKTFLAALSLAALSVAVPASAEVVGSATITNANHYGYFGNSSLSAQNTKATVGPFNGVARVIRVTGTITEVNSAAWVSSIRVHPSGGNLAGYQPGFKFGNYREFSGTVDVKATIYAPGGLDLSAPMQFEMYSIDAEQYVPGLDARSTLTYEFDSAYDPGTVEFSGTIDTTDPTFQRPGAGSVTVGGANEPIQGTPFLTFFNPHYDVRAFTVDTAGEYTMAVASEFESASMLYEGSFDPSDPLANVVRVQGEEQNVIRNNSFNDLTFNDDATGGTLITWDLVPGTVYYHVMTAYSEPGGADDGGPFVGDYTGIITGAGQVSLGTAIPEPTVGLLAGLGLLMGRRKRQAVA